MSVALFWSPSFTWTAAGAAWGGDAGVGAGAPADRSPPAAVDCRGGAGLDGEHAVRTRPAVSAAPTRRQRRRSRLPVPVWRRGLSARIAGFLLLRGVESGTQV